jgi:hypothetical protein
MVQTTSQVNACDVVVTLDDQTGTPADISGSSNQVTMNLTNDSGTTQTFGAGGTGRFPVRTQCRSDAEITFRAVYSRDDGEAMRILLDWFFIARGHKTLEVNIPDDGVGADKYTFEVILQRMNVPVDGTSADPILAECTLQPTGEFTWAVIGS